MKRRPALLLLLTLLATACSVSAVEDANEAADKVQVRVRGCGPVVNRQLLQTLRLLKSDASQRPYYDAADVEDAALILMARMRDEGYLLPAMTVRLTLPDGSAQALEWDEELYSRLPPDLRATRVHFQIRRGVRFYFREVSFEGLTALRSSEALRFFMGMDFLLAQKSTRLYTPGRLASALRGLTEALQQKGYEDAEVTTASLRRDDERGTVTLVVSVNEGRRSIVRTVRQEIAPPEAIPPVKLPAREPDTPYSRLWEQNYTQTLQRELYRQGFPDAAVALTPEERDTTGDTTAVNLLARIEPGDRVRLGAVRFEGEERTRRSVLERRAGLEPGGWLDRVDVERARFRLARLGVFDRVELDYDPPDGSERDAVFTLEEGKRMDVSLLAGYGSYEMLRGGVELEQRNLFGLAHRSRLRAVQSFKSTTADFAYTMPDLIGGETDVFVRGSYLRREEIDFLRREYGGGVGAQRFLPALQTHAGLRFNYQRVQATRSEVNPEIGPQDATVSAWVLDLARERRDSPIDPRRGYHLAVSQELAAEWFGGNVNYYRVELGGSYHFDLGGGRRIHLGVTHGVALTLGEAGNDLPLAKRFFPGGENSVRGYQYGEAAPRDAEGRIVGAEAFLLGNLELEQALTPAWSIVAFCDAIGLAEQVADYPFNERLYSVGGGIRWKTVIGPVRLEYGHNLNRRPHDPAGTLHFSIGFPF